MSLARSAAVVRRLAVDESPGLDSSPDLEKVPAAHNLACEQEPDRIESDGWADRRLYSRLLAQLTLRVMELPPVETTLALSGASQIVKRLALLRRDGFCGWKWRDSLPRHSAWSQDWPWSPPDGGFQPPMLEPRRTRLRRGLPNSSNLERRYHSIPSNSTDTSDSIQLGPRVFFTITREGDHFFSQLPGQQKFEIYPESPTTFFYTVVVAAQEPAH